MSDSVSVCTLHHEPDERCGCTTSELPGDPAYWRLYGQWLDAPLTRVPCPVRGCAWRDISTSVDASTRLRDIHVAEVHGVAR